MPQTPSHRVRNIFVGGHALTDGFRLIGFETFTDPDAQQLEQLLSSLLREKQRALLIIEQSVNRIDSKLLHQIRNEGGYIVLTEIPSLHNPEDFQSELDETLKQLTGG
ncbi:MAG: V-type ATP synthase subunit F [Candidatus Thiodiazotropha sp.]|jgi:vacuolar-type H+-ATPase subunit F/Vma7